MGQHKKESVTTLRFWRDNINMGRIGHVSVETKDKNVDENNIHASFWPEMTENDQQTGTDHDLMERPKSQHYRGIEGEHHSSFEEDLNAEGGGIRKGFLNFLWSFFNSSSASNPDAQPDVIIKLYGLDILAMRKAYDNFINHNYKWATLGSSILGCPKTSNCCGFANHLFYVGGIRRKRWAYVSHARFIATPGLIVTMYLFCKMQGISFDLIPASLLTFTVISLVGGFMDYASDAFQVHRTLSAVRNVRDIGFMKKGMLMMGEFVILTLSLLICPIASLLLITNPTQWFLTTPGHIEQLARGVCLFGNGKVKKASQNNQSNTQQKNDPNANNTPKR